MLMRVYNDVTLGLTTAHWLETCMNELLVPHRKGLTQWDVPEPGPANVHTAQTLYFCVRITALYRVYKSTSFTKF